MIKIKINLKVLAQLIHRPRLICLNLFPFPFSCVHTSFPSHWTFYGSLNNQHTCLLWAFAYVLLSARKVSMSLTLTVQSGYHFLIIKILTHKTLFSASPNKLGCDFISSQISSPSILEPSSLQPSYSIDSCFFMFYSTLLLCILSHYFPFWSSLALSFTI